MYIFIYTQSDNCCLFIMPRLINVCLDKPGVQQQSLKFKILQYAIEDHVAFKAPNIKSDNFDDIL